MQLTLLDTRIRQDAQGRHCLNDLHRAAVAAGANVRAKEPGKFFRSPRTQELLALLQQEQTTPNWGSTLAPVSAIDLGNATSDSVTPNWGDEIAPIHTIQSGDPRLQGTYVCIELVIAYGQFVSARFDLKVIRTFLAVQHAQHAMPHIQSRKFWDALRPHWAQISALALTGLKNVQIAAQVGRSPASVGHCLQRQYLVGYTHPVEVFKARMRPATAARWAIEKPVAAQWGLPTQPAAQGVLWPADAKPSPGLRRRTLPKVARDQHGFPVTAVPLVTPAPQAQGGAA